MKNFWPFRPFEFLLATIASLCIWEIASVGFDIDHSDPSLTITYFVTSYGWLTVLASMASLAFGIGLAIHFVYEYIQRHR